MKKDRKGYLKKGIQNPRNAWYVVRTKIVFYNYDILKFH